MAFGFNQAIIFACLMVIIAAFIGTQDLGQELQRPLDGTLFGSSTLVFCHFSMKLWNYCLNAPIYRMLHIRFS